ncbi:haloacid dehalogenase [Weizmannia acidilactici]|uniref:Haloacid dehalogenase n=1 Tax=Weizmannia acidilactici TaxID=2607726 RepID=A0A5J4JCG4_9BACI|nr:HAD family hydrolase [Weizmannia acidilactici]GER69663.1 haloacid dehalogenase [Weizmannia acidilactici]GER72517.1 haloacid dehalogenase [Weizmannia acidilactici]
MIRTVLFDVDGVLLSEERYFDASGLTVWEMIHSSHYLGLAPEKFKTTLSDEEITRIRAEVFRNDQVLRHLKSQGMNANWDMIYLTFTCQLLHLLSQIKEKEAGKIREWLTHEIDYEVLGDIRGILANYQVSTDFGVFLKDFAGRPETKQDLLKVLDQLAFEKFGITGTALGRKGALWSVCEHASQEWYVGDQHILASTGKPSVQTGKKGFLEEEIPLAGPEEIADLFSYLSEKGLNLGVGTGRPQLETYGPFRALGWLPLFDENHIVTADEVLKAEGELGSATPLAKPNPFTYLFALEGKQTSVRDCVNTPLPLKNGKEVLIVGDSLADLLAAQKMGCVFAGILTGLSGKEARVEFEAHGADYIFENVTDLKTIFM